MNEERFELAFPKKKIIKSSSAIKQHAREFPTCEIGGPDCGIGRIFGGVHHILPRSRGGGDVEENLISLCGVHHTRAHDGKISPEELRNYKKLSFGDFVGHLRIFKNT